MKILIDTNILIGLENDGVIEARFANFMALCQKHSVRLYVHEASIEDIQRDKNTARRDATLSKLAKFQTLKKVHTPATADLEKRYGPIKKDNDVVDCRLLHALELSVVDFLISEDGGIGKRAKLVGIDSQVFRLDEALSWLARQYEGQEVALPEVQSLKAFSLDPKDPIFDELRVDYAPDFDDWLERARTDHRDCWVIMNGGSLAGVIIRKHENQAEAQTKTKGSRVLKLSTFKVAAPFRGQKLGEQLLKQALWHAQLNKYDVVYVTLFASKQKALLELLENYGFAATGVKANGETVMEKAIGKGPVARLVGEPALDATRRTYPRFVADKSVDKFVVPIWPIFHAKLFPEYRSKAPAAKGTGRPGNTIEKVYLSHSRTNRLKPGDVLLFYMTKQAGSVGSQSITSIGVVKSARLTGDLNELKKWTAKRSVYSEAELQQMVNHGVVLVIDFILVGHFEGSIPLPVLIGNGILNGWPQSISSVSSQRFEKLKGMSNLGFTY